MEMLYLVVSNLGYERLFKSVQRERISYRDELLYLCILYHVMLFVPGFIGDENAINNVGYSLCGLYGLFLLLDLITIIKSFIFKVYGKIKIWFIIWLAKKRLEKHRAKTVT